MPGGRVKIAERRHASGLDYGARNVVAGECADRLKRAPARQHQELDAVIARCLDPSRYFAFVDMLFSKQEDWAFKDDAFAPLKKFAKQAGLPDDQFNKCLDDEALQKKILAVREQGAKEGVSGTPSFFVNGKLIKGPPTLKTLAEAAKPYLNTKG